MSVDIYETFKKSFYSYTGKNPEKLNVGVAVSGGADSICLLILLKRLFSEELKDKKCNLFCLTVNHNIRPEAETNHDRDFVKTFCKNRGIECKVLELPRGLVEKTAEERKGGIEDAARFLRYKAFDECAKEYNLSYICLAHNENDFLETSLMRYFQGSTSLQILGNRGIYIRPLLQVSRNDIEDFLNKENQSYCTDSTNADDRYLRNTIRLNVMPVLDEKIPGWKNGVKNFTSKVTEAMACETFITDGCSFNAGDFEILSKAQKERVLIQLMNNFGYEKRIPHAFLQDAVYEISRGIYNKKDWKKTLGEVTIVLKNGKILVEKPSINRTDWGFFDIIREEGIYSYAFGDIAVSKKEGQISVSFQGNTYFFEVDFPFCLRSPITGDKSKKNPFVVEKI